jgi:hypothetical protein
MDSSSYGAHADMLGARLSVRAAEDGHLTLLRAHAAVAHVGCCCCQLYGVSMACLWRVYGVFSMAYTRLAVLVCARLGTARGEQNQTVACGGGGGWRETRDAQGEGRA